MKKFALSVFIVASLYSLSAGAQPDQRVVQEVRRDRQGIVKHEAQLETLDGTVKALLEYCAKVGSREELLKKLEKRKQSLKKRVDSGKKPAPPKADKPAPPAAVNLPEPPKSCDKADLEEWLKKLQATVANHEVRIKALEEGRAALQTEINNIHARNEAHFRALLAELAKQFPQLKPQIIKVEQSLGDYEKLKTHFNTLLERMDALEAEMAEMRRAFADLLDNVDAMLVQVKNKQDTLRFQLAPMAAGHYDGDITRFFALMSAELIIPLHRFFALTAGGALGKGPRGFGTMFRAGGEVGGIARFRFAGVGVWDFRHAGTITRWIGGTVGLGVYIPLYQDQPHYKRPPVELVLFLDAGIGWLAEYGKDVLSPLGMAGAGVRF